eukprot:jgi/Bigna1/74634/fgenesh1_pg.30_\
MASGDKAAGLVFEKQQVPASNSLGVSLLGKMFDDTSEGKNQFEPPADEERSGNNKKEEKEENISEDFHEDLSAYTYADNDDGDVGPLPFHCKIWIASKKSIDLEIHEVLSIGKLLSQLSSHIKPTKELKEDLSKVCVLFAADENGERDEDCPRLDVNGPIHTAGVKDFIMLHIDGAEGQKLLSELQIPKEQPVIIGDKKKTLLNDPKTKFFHAAETGNLSLVKKMLSAKMVKLEDKGIDNWTALHYAARSGHYHIVLFLIRHDANLDASSKTGWTPLHLACYQGHYDTVDILLQSGAKSNLKTNDGKAPIVYAEDKGAHDIVELFDEFKGPDVL